MSYVIQEFKRTDDDDQEFCGICRKNDAGLKKVIDLEDSDKTWFEYYVCRECGKKIGSGKIIVKDVVMCNGLAVSDYIEFNDILKEESDQKEQYEMLAERYDKHQKIEDWEKMVGIIFDYMFEDLEANNEEIKIVARKFDEEEINELPARSLVTILEEIRKHGGVSK